MGVGMAPVSPWNLARIKDFDSRIRENNCLSNHRRYFRASASRDEQKGRGSIAGGNGGRRGAAAGEDNRMAGTIGGQIAFYSNE